MSNRRTVKKAPDSLQQAIQMMLGLDLPSKDRKYSIEQIAAECGRGGIDPAYPYRWASTNEHNYAPITIDNLKAVMDLTGNFQVLDFFERRYGRLSVKIPKGLLSKKDEGDLIDDYRELTVDAVKILLSFFKNPIKETKDAVDNVLEEVMRSTATIKRYADKKAAGQFEMEL